MTAPQNDDRSRKRRALDEQIAAEPELPPPALPTDASSAPLEAYLHQHHRPVAVPGVVENGVIRPLDPTVKLPEHSRVIIVATELK